MCVSILSSVVRIHISALRSALPAVLVCDEQCDLQPTPKPVSPSCCLGLRLVEVTQARVLMRLWLIVISCYPTGVCFELLNRGYLVNGYAVEDKVFVNHHGMFFIYFTFHGLPVRLISLLYSLHVSSFAASEANATWCRP